MKSLFALALLITLSFHKLVAQSYEGKLTYSLEMKNPMPDKMPDEIWNQKLGERFGGVTAFTQSYYYKQNRYKSEVQMGDKINYQLYVPKEKLIYNWEKGGSEAITIDSQKYMDKIKEVKHSEDTETILGITCKKVTIVSEMAENTYWYNKDHFKVDSKYFEGHAYGHFETVLKEVGCLPLKIETKQFMVNMVLTLKEYKDGVEDTIFKLPIFSEVMASPAN